ncbi:hypothetical protein M438DRAFT_349391 [Aureobasidium pullulans EXF-150]|uniref:Secreted protein n=1 Tax=Aureobasidium pullulans EXF-150 TaxID=1043002 RepID=A0A074X321_AURPU|nr:uncharacterized protein M438DRAFT_349391 [Aureobasidium pullulans EXF-150]KEQ79920.1 hypothetical protein M438DRAFT_349391 [Aureobasidium pullulans EXF-150]
MLACFARRCNLFFLLCLLFVLLPASFVNHHERGSRSLRPWLLTSTFARYERLTMISFSSAHLLLDAQNQALVIY